MHLSPSETAHRFGISIKALRLYESRGLLAPLRSEAGWRTYGPDQIARLHQILALKRLGLPLTRIAELLAGANGLDAVLAIQEQALARDSDRLARALELVKAARAKLADGQALSIDDLAKLSQETVMTPKPDAQAIKQLTDDYARKHFTADEMARMQSHATSEALAHWEAVIADAKNVMAAGDPASPAARDVARRWQAAVHRLSGGETNLMTKGRAAWREALGDPKVAAGLPLSRELLDFIGQAKAHLTG